MSSLRYRFGFISLHEENRRTAQTPVGWRCSALRGGLVVLTHPEAPILKIGEKAFIVGHCFSTQEGRSISDILGADTTSVEAFHDSLDDLSGRFAAFVWREGWRIYNDACGSRTIFYKTKGAFGAASHSALLGEAFAVGKNQLTNVILSDPAFRQRGVTYLPGDLSFYDGIYGLVPNNYYDVTQRYTVRYWPRNERLPSNFDAFESECDRYFRAFARSGVKGHGLILGVTPGIDSRTLIAAFKHFGRKMKYVTWRDYALPESDVPLAKRMIEYLGGEHVYMYGKAKAMSEELRAIALIAEENTAQGRGASNLTANMYAAYHGKALSFVRGYGGEIMRGFYNLTKGAITENSSAEFARVYGPSVRKFTASEDYKTAIIRAMEGFMERAHYASLEESGYDINDIFYWEQRMGMWGAAMHNEMDAAVLSLTGYNSRQLYALAFGLPREQRLSKDLLRNLTHRYDPGLAAIPVA